MGSVLAADLEGSPIPSRDDESSSAEADRLLAPAIEKGEKVSGINQDWLCERVNE